MMTTTSDNLCRICGSAPAFDDAGVCRWESCEREAKQEAARLVGAMQVEVEMHAFMDGAIRTVRVPAGYLASDSTQEEVLNAVFYYGQNDHQPQRMCSVSRGDVVRLNGKRFRVESFGFAEV